MGTELRGIMAVSLTPFDADLRIDTARIGPVLAPLTGGVVDAVVVNGNTGEYYALSHEERMFMLSESAVVLHQDISLIAGVGGDLPTALREAAHARSLGYVGVMVHHPVHPYLSLDGWGVYHRTIAEAVSDLLVLPYIKSDQVTGEAVGELHRTCPNVAGVKYAVADPVLFATTVEQAQAPGLAWFCGLAESWAPFFAAAGAVGFTSGLVNLTSSPSRALDTALREGDRREAMRLWHLIRPFEELRARHRDANNVAVIKEALHQAGVCGREVRPPATPLSLDERAEVAAMLPQLDGSLLRR
jgi:4-hydroxy-tetrahydrodipicolinate synthase